MRTTDTIRHAVKALRYTVIACLACAAGGCALHYYDTDTGTEHLWGIGHLKMKASTMADARQATVTGSETLGLGIGKDQEGYVLDAGYANHRRIEIVSPNTSLGLQWPSGDFFDVRIGPFGTTGSSGDSREK